MLYAYANENHKLKKLRNPAHFLYVSALTTTTIYALATGSVLIANPIMWNCAVAFLPLGMLYMLFANVFFCIGAVCYPREQRPPALKSLGCITSKAFVLGFSLSSIMVGSIGIFCGLAKGYLSAGSVFGNLAISYLSLLMIFVPIVFVRTSCHLKKIRSEHKKFVLPLMSEIKLCKLILLSLTIASFSHLLVVTQSVSTVAGVLLAITLALATVSALLQTVELAQFLIARMNSMRHESVQNNSINSDHNEALSANVNKSINEDNGNDADKSTSLQEGNLKSYSTNNAQHSESLKKVADWENDNLINETSTTSSACSEYLSCQVMIMNPLIVGLLQVLSVRLN